MKDRVSLFIFCQSMGWDMMQKLPFVDGLADIRSAARPILGSPCATLPTVLSGTLPERHKHFAWFFYSPMSTPFRMCRYFSFLPRIKKSQRVRDNIVLAVKKTFGITGRLSTFNMPLKHLPLFDFVERRNLLQPGALDDVPTLFDFLAESNVSYFCSSPDRADVENADALSNALMAGKISVGFWHLAGIDTILTRLGPASSALRGRVAWVDHRIRGIYEIARSRYRRVDLIIFSDSGMVPIFNVYNLQRRIEETRFNPYEDFVAIYEPTMARFWFKSPSSALIIARILESVPCGTILSRDELAKEGCWFDDHRFGEIIFLAQPGTVFTPNHMHGESPAAARGYHPDTPEMAAGIISNTPGIQPPRTVAEIYNILVQNVMDLPNFSTGHPHPGMLIKAREIPPGKAGLLQ